MASSNLSHDSLVGSSDSAVIVRPNIRNQGHHDEQISDFVPQMISWGQTARASLRLHDSMGTAATCDDIFITYNVGLQTASAIVTTIIGNNIALTPIQSLRIMSEGSVLWECDGWGVMWAILSQNAQSVTTVQEENIFPTISSWRSGAGHGAEDVLLGSGVGAPHFFDVSISLNDLTEGFFRDFNIARLNEITVEILFRPMPSNTANLKEISCYFGNAAGTTVETDVTSDFAFTNLQMRMSKTIWEAGNHLQPLHNPVRSLIHQWQLIEVPFDATSATVRVVSISLGTQYSKKENIQRIMCWTNGHGDMDGGAQLFSTHGYMQPIASHMFDIDRVNCYHGNHVSGWRIYRHNKLVQDCTTVPRMNRANDRLMKRRYGATGPCTNVTDLQTYLSKPTSIDMCSSSGHEHSDMRTHVLSGVSNEAPNEWRIDIHFPANKTRADQYPATLFCLLEFQTVLEINNNGQPASVAKPVITKLVN